MKLSVVIPSRNEQRTLEKTLRNLQENITGDTDVHVILDRWEPEQPIDMNDKRFFFHHFPEGIGQRGGMNWVVENYVSDIYFKLDAHCAVSPGFDDGIRETFQELGGSPTVVPLMYNLDVETWLPKKHKRTTQMYMAVEKGDLRALYYNSKKKPDIGYGDFIETMACMGPGWAVKRDWFIKTGMCDTNGVGQAGWGAQSVEVSCKAWMSGEKLITTKKCWFAHWFRGGVGFPYPIRGKEVDSARKYHTDLWLNDKWEHRHPERTWKWLLNKFTPPGWEHNLNELQNRYKGETCYIVAGGPSAKKYTRYDGPVIAINQIGEHLESLKVPNLYWMQKDKAFQKPSYATLLCSLHESVNAHTDYDPRMVFDASILAPGKHGHKEFSANIALKIAQLMGCDEIKMIGFDAHFGDYTNTNWETSREGEYKRQHERMKSLIEENKLNVKFVSPDEEETMDKFVLEYTKGKTDLTVEERNLHAYFYRKIHLRDNGEHFLTENDMKECRWRGYRMLKFPSDIAMYQEAIWDKKPDYIVEIGSAYGGAALMYADFLNMYGGKKVISIDPTPRGDLPWHPDIIWLKGDSKDPAIIQQVKDIVGDGSVMLSIDGWHAKHQVQWELKRYRGIVTVGQYMVVEDCYGAHGEIVAPGKARDWFLKWCKRYKLTDHGSKYVVAVSKKGWLLRVK